MGANVTKKDPATKPDYAHMNLSELSNIVWSLLSVGVINRHSPFHTPALATIGDNGPEVRTVVLRHSDPEARQISCHTDRRSAKRSQIESHKRVSWLFYNPELKIQLRARGKVTVHTDTDLAEQRWQRSSLSSRMCYATNHTPGQIIEAPLPAPLDSDNGRSQFAVLLCDVDSIDWLYLNAFGHQRALLHWQNNEWASTWLAP